MCVLVRDDLEDTDEDIAKYGDGSVILCTDDYHTYNGTEEHEGADAQLAVTHDDTYVIGGAHTNTCENRHSFLREWLANFRGVSKHHLQQYLDFLALDLNPPKTWVEKLPRLQCIGMSERWTTQRIRLSTDCQQRRAEYCGWSQHHGPSSFVRA